MLRSSRVDGAMEQVRAEAQRLATPAQVGIAPAADALEHRRNVEVSRLLEGIAFDRAALNPFVFVPLVCGRDERVQWNQPSVDPRLYVAPMITTLVLRSLKMCQIRRGR